MTKYVCGFLMDHYGQVLLVRKNKPEWQAGKLNGIGGKIEEGEEPLFAMVREWKEETGESRTNWRLFCRLIIGEAEVFFYAARTDNNIRSMWRWDAKNDVQEALVCIFGKSISSHKSIPNLNWLIPLAFADEQCSPYAEVTSTRP